MSLRSIRTRLALLVFAITLVAVGFVYVYVAPPLENALRKQRLDALAAAATRHSGPIIRGRDKDIETLRLIVRQTGDRANARVTLLRVNRLGVGLETQVVTDSTGSADAMGLQFEVATDAAREGQPTTGTESSREGRQGIAAVPIRVGGSVKQVIAYSTPLSDVDDNVALVRSRIAVAGAIALALALAGGFLLSQRLARRIKRLEGTARRVAAGDLTGRFVVDSADELGQLAVALDDMQRQLGELDSARKRFIATASHELRTPIFSLGGFLELIQDEELDAETRDAFLTQVRDQVERLQKLAVDLLDLSKLEAGSLELRPEPTDVGMLARAVTSEFQPALARHDANLELRLGRAPVQAEIDPERVAQILRILIDNALTHTPPGTDMIVTASRNDDHVRLAVRDFGAGIGRQSLERLFEPFYSAGDGQGSGLGLAIARELAERMDGRLAVEAVSGRTTFTLEVPA